LFFLATQTQKWQGIHTLSYLEEGLTCLGPHNSHWKFVLF
jgi:hypothetical protein